MLSDGSVELPYVFFNKKMKLVQFCSVPYNFNCTFISKSNDAVFNEIKATDTALQ